MTVYRTVVRQAEFEADLDALTGDMEIRRVDEFLMGAEWVLCRNPEAGSRVAEDPEVWMLPMYKLGEPVALYYTFTDNKIWFEGIASLDSDDTGYDDESEE